MAQGKKAKIDLGEVERLSALQVTDEELAAFFCVTTRTIERRRKSKAFREAIERGKMRGRISLRRLQFKCAESGSAPLLVFLGKQYLGQTDHVAVSGPGPTIIVSLPQMPHLGRNGTLEGHQQARSAPDEMTIDVTPQE